MTLRVTSARGTNEPKAISTLSMRVRLSLSTIIAQSKKTRPVTTRLTKTAVSFLALS